MRVWPSELNLLQHCPGSKKLRGSLVEEGVDLSTKWMSFGLLAHRWAEEWLHTRSYNAADVALREMNRKEGSKFEPSALIDLSVAMVEWADWWSAGEARLLPIREGIEEKLQVQFGDVVISGKVDYWKLVEGTAGRTLVVADWKWYNNPSALLPLEDDLQMLCYGVLADLKLQVSWDVMAINRVLLKQCKMDAMLLSKAKLQEVHDRVLHIIQRVARTDELIPGLWCGNCFLKSYCHKYKRQAEEVVALGPYTGKAIANAKEALYYLLRLKPAKDRVKDLEVALRFFAEKHGHIEHNGQVWGRHERKQDVITDAPAVIKALIDAIGVEAAMVAVQTTKSALESALVKAGVAPADRNAWMGRMRKKGLIKKQAGDRFEWRKKGGGK